MPVIALLSVMQFFNVMVHVGDSPTLIDLAWIVSMVITAIWSLDKARKPRVMSHQQRLNRRRRKFDA